MFAQEKTESASCTQPGSSYQGRWPPPATTRKIEVTYLGFYQIGEGPKQTSFKLDASFKGGPIGAQIAPELFIANATMQALTLTNVAGQTNIIGLNTNKEIIVPIR